MTESEFVHSGLADFVSREVEQLIIEQDRKHPNTTKKQTFRKG